MKDFLLTADYAVDGKFSDVLIEEAYVEILEEQDRLLLDFALTSIKEFKTASIRKFNKRKKQRRAYTGYRK